LSHSFRGFCPLSLGSVDSEPMVRQNIMMAGVGDRGCSPHGSQKSREEGKTR
jgi:hypothetical protein